MRPFARGLVAALLALPVAVSAQPTTCDGDLFETLDFWVGAWDVYQGEQQVGQSQVEKALAGCAVIERWTDGRGWQGMSLFYVEPHAGEWKQVWVTERALAPGGTKEKDLVERLDDGSVRFQGVVPSPNGGSWLDRTTLTPLPEGRVRQRIETSVDGEAWQVRFEAVYVPVEP